jgi:hypothetical protein
VRHKHDYYLRDSNIILSKMHNIMGSMYHTIWQSSFNLYELTMSAANSPVDVDVENTLIIFCEMKRTMLILHILLRRPT